MTHDLPPLGVGVAIFKNIFQPFSNLLYICDPNPEKGWGKLCDLCTKVYAHLSFNVDLAI